MKAWLKGCAVWAGFILAGWLLILAIGYAILRGVVAFLSLYED